jgi:hypothetical protein
MLYNGPDRRVHTCFITRNREYHTRSGVCVVENQGEDLAGH